MAGGRLSTMIRFLGSLAARRDGDATDAELLRRFAARDESAFARLVERHGPMVRGVCRRVLRHEQDAEDAFQATFLVLARKARSVSGPGRLANWLYGVAYRVALKARARSAWWRASRREVGDMAAPEHTPEMVWADLRPVLDEEVSRLPEKYRLPFVLCYLEGRTNEEAARLMACPKGTVLSRLAWARERLRARLTRRGLAPSAALLGTLLGQGAAPAGVPVRLVSSTAELVMRLAAAPPGVSALAEGVLRAMMLSKLKRAALALLVLVPLGGGVALLGRPAEESGGKEERAPGAKAPREDLRETLLALEKRSWEALKRQDATALGKLAAKEFVAVLSDGSRLTGEEFLKQVPHFRVKDYALNDVRLTRLGPDAALLTYRVRSATEVLGETKRETSQACSIWVRRDGKWLSAFYQETPLKK
jgi:RNA polymerase sigma factor (sigma-70 family)